MSRTKPRTSRRRGRPSRALAEQLTTQIVETAKTFFLRYGYEQTTMDAIAGELGMSKRTLYTRFPGKAALFNAFVKQEIDRHFAALETIDLDGRPLREQLTLIGEHFLSAILDTDMVALERVVTAEANQFPELAHLIYDYAAPRLIGLVSDMLEAAATDDRLGREDHARDAEIFIGMVVLPPLRRAILKQEARLPLENRDMLERRVEIFLNGVMNGRA